MWLEQAVRKISRDLLTKHDPTEALNGVLLSRLLLREQPDAVVEEWSKVVINTVHLLNDVLTGLEVVRRKRPDLDQEARASCELLAERLDFALALICRNVVPVIRVRAHLTDCTDLMVHALRLVEGESVEAAGLVERIQKDHPEVDRPIDAENMVDSFAWETYQRVAELDRLVDRYPDHARWAARQMHAWPTLRSRHHSNDARFYELAEKLELGRDYPLDASAAARFRPDTPMVRLLDPLLVRLCHLQTLAKRWGKKFQMTPTTLRGSWWNHLDPEPNEREIAALRRLATLPPLTKRSAKRWAKEVVVPVILATNDTGYQCTEPALRQVLQQRDVKSRAIFRSRLEAAVSSYLRRMARND